MYKTRVDGCLNAGKDRRESNGIHPIEEEVQLTHMSRVALAESKAETLQKCDGIVPSSASGVGSPHESKVSIEGMSSGHSHYVILMVINQASTGEVCLGWWYLDCPWCSYLVLECEESGREIRVSHKCKRVQGS